RRATRWQPAEWIPGGSSTTSGMPASPTPCAIRPCRRSRSRISGGEGPRLGEEHRASPEVPKVWLERLASPLRYSAHYPDRYIALFERPQVGISSPEQFQTTSDGSPPVQGAH